MWVCKVEKCELRLRNGGFWGSTGTYKLQSEQQSHKLIVMCLGIVELGRGEWGHDLHNRVCILNRIS